MKLLMLLATVVFLALTLPHPTLAQDTLWTRVYGGTNQDWAESIEQTADGGFIIGGYSASFGYSPWDIYLIKTDVHGDTLWTRTYGAPGTDYTTCVHQTSDEGYVVAIPEGYGDLLRLDASGDSVWLGDYQMQARSVKETTDGGFIVAGDAGGHCCLVKADSHGEETWRYTYPIGEFSQAFSVIETQDGGYAAGGSTWIEGGGWDYYVVRTTSTGEEIWARSYGRPISDDEGWAICQAADGGFVITGLYFGTLKVDAHGDSLWNHYYGEGSMGCAFSICQPNDHSFAIGGYVDPLGEDDGNYFMVTTDDEGQVIFEREYGGGSLSFDNGRCVQPTADGSFVMIGWTDAFGPGDMDIWLVKIGNENSFVESPVAPHEGIELFLSNPVRSGTGIDLTYRVPSPGRVQIEILNVLGQRVFATSQSHEAGGSYEILCPTQRLPGGVYFVRLQAGDFVRSEKFVLLAR